MILLSNYALQLEPDLIVYNLQVTTQSLKDDRQAECWSQAKSKYAYENNQLQNTNTDDNDMKSIMFTTICTLFA